MTLFAIERRQKILDMVAEANSISVSELSRLLGVSVVTIRKDLEILENDGLVTKTYGGVILGRNPRHAARPADEAETEAFSPLVVEAAKMIAPGQTIMMGQGGFVAELANYIRNFENLTVITISVDVALKLMKAPCLDVILTGGIMRPRTMTMLGHLAERVIKEIDFDLSFSEADGLDPTVGITSASIVEAGTDAVLYGVSKHPVILAEGSAVGKVASSFIAKLKPQTKIILSGRPNEQIVKQLSEIGIEVVVTTGGAEEC